MDRKKTLDKIAELLRALSKADKAVIAKGLFESAIPTSIFNSSLSCLEVIVVFLRENEGKTFTDIGRLLKRNTSTIFLTYRNARKKSHEKLKISDGVNLDPKLFSDRRYTSFEILIKTLHEDYGISFRKICIIVNRKYTTVTSTYYRVKKK